MPNRREHTAHDFSRLLSKGIDGRGVYGCSYGSAIAGCAETEVRAIGAASPFALKRQQQKARQRREGVTA